MLMFILGALISFFVPFLLIYSIVKPSHFSIRTEKHKIGKWSRLESILFFIVVWILSITLMTMGSVSDSADKFLKDTQDKPLAEGRMIA